MCFSAIACNRSHYGSSSYEATNEKTELTCKLMPDELRARKETVLKSLQAKVIDMKELPKGYAFKFPGSDEVLAELFEFIRTERECCSFFIFNLSISGDKSEAWLELTGVEGAKDFITDELGF
jgi:hypothetical protein